MLLPVVHVDILVSPKTSTPTRPAAPYPFFANLNSPSLFNSVLRLLGFKPTNSSPLGFMPRQNPCTTLVPIDVAYSPSVPISCSHLGTHSPHSEIDTQASGLCQSSLRTRSPTDSFYSLSSLSLSEILQHHIQSNTPQPQPSIPISSSLPISLISKSPLPKPKQLARASSKHILDNSGQNIHIRDTRTNSRHLCMLVIEINMMRAQKIVCPLRPRHSLAKRKDAFVADRPSRLRE
ncbi:hypothetical protein CLU79DRAFT_767326 [Phycomyces nitens]|nr:hypothetical protein CLU79DRAFT_767326 [Phycomyces nitens]